MIYTIHMKDQAVAGVDDVERASDYVVAIAETNSKTAIFFPPVWLFYHKLWWELLVYGLVIVLIFSLLATPLAAASFFLSGLPGIYLYLEGHQLIRARLEREGYQLVDVLDASDEESAVGRFLENWKPKPVTRSKPVSTLPARQSEPSIGLFLQGES